MKRIIIVGNRTLTGKIKISGAKNSAVALIPATILSDEPVIINNVPNISDIDALITILKFLNAKVIRKDNSLIIDSSKIENKEIPEDISKKLRASYYFMSSILGKYKKVNMYFPGGCNIGKRPIDQTLKAFKNLGSVIEEKDNKYNIYAEKLIGSEIILDMPSVGATINAIFASVKADGKTIIKNAAQEPEIDNVIEMINKMGGDVKRENGTTIIINGVKSLHGTTIDVIPDRIEAGTYIIIGALIRKDWTLENVVPKHTESLLLKLKEANVKYELKKNSITLNKSDKLKPVNIETKGYPGFATDLQQPFTVLLTQCDGVSYLTENIYENRFNNVSYLNKMGANIEIIDKTIKIDGKTSLKGTTVVATDLRAGACMVIAALIASGTTIIEDIDHVLRGYEDIIKKLETVGAKIIKEEI